MQEIRKFCARGFWTAIISLVLIAGLSDAALANGVRDTPFSGENLSTADVAQALATAWIIIATVLIFMMQLGFLFLENGLVRAKNSINIAQKNLSDIIISILLFSAIGFSIMFGHTVYGLWGFEPGWMFARDLPAQTLSLFVFQAVFCGTAATIVAGAVAERMSITAFFAATVLISGLIFPVFGHWVWGDAIVQDQAPLLVQRGFYDFAGATVVHSLGAWVGLVATLMIGPRIGKFNDAGKPVHIQGHNMAVAAAGGLFLWLGWIGFNAGPVSPFDPVFPTIVANTLVAGAAGGLVHILLGRTIDGLYRPGKSINGIICGLVSVTAGANVFSTADAILIAAMGSGLAFFLRMWMERRLKVDDPVSVVSVHGLAGVWATLAVALFGDMDMLPMETRGAQFIAQLEGILLAFVWAGGVAFVGLKAIDYGLQAIGKRGLRVAEESERQGLNYSEHGDMIGTGALQDAMSTLMREEIDWSKRVDIEPGHETDELSATFNKIMDRLQEDHEWHLALQQQRTDEMEKALSREQELNLLQQNFVSMVSHEFRTPVTIIDNSAQRLARKKDRIKPLDIEKVTAKIRKAVLRMTALIESTLSASQLEAGRIEFAPQTIDLALLIKECCDYQQELSTNHEIISDLSALPTSMFGDPMLLTQVFANLLSNAVKYAPDSPNILVTTKQVGEELFSISVIDQGLGIPADEMESLFTRFFRARTSVGIAGTGVGLNVVKQFAELHGGSVSVSSIEGEGTTFEVILPRKAKIPVVETDERRRFDQAAEPMAQTSA